jgi:hypothetical protein
LDRTSELAPRTTSLRSFEHACETWPGTKFGGAPAKAWGVDGFPDPRDSGAERGRLEVKWVVFMLANGWLDANLRDSVVTLTAYPGDHNTYERTFDLNVPVFMDIRWVTAKPHWTVYVTKVGKKSVPKSTVGWAVRQIYLDPNDFVEREECFGPPKDLCVAQMPVVHEFGHTLGNIGGVHGGLSDEYNEKSLFSGDLASVMNRGNELRARHFNHMINELSGMVPDTVFSLGRLQ